MPNATDYLYRGHLLRIQPTTDGWTLTSDFIKVELGPRQERKHLVAEIASFRRAVDRYLSKRDEAVAVIAGFNAIDAEGIPDAQA